MWRFPISVRCPHLLSLGFHDNLVASTLNNQIGSTVDFQCTEPKPVLSGPESIKCTVYGKWNDTLPTCLTSDLEETTSIFTDDVDVTTSSSSASADENEVESVIIILWIAGGLLLITLLILIGCILKTHKKQRNTRQGSIRCPTQGQGHPRHGGVNPTFTSYDEIWTWIPVVTENSDNCRNQSRGSTSGRGNGVSSHNNNSSRNSRLPSYNEAINNAASNRVSNPDPSRRPATNQAIAGPSQTSTNQATLQIRPITTRSSHTGGACSTSHTSNMTSQVTMETNHYDTIPADQRQSHPVNGNNVTYVSVTSSSGSALQQARDLVNRASAQAQRPLPSAPVLQTGSRQELQYNQRQQQQHRLPDGVRQTAGQRSRSHTSVHQQPVYLPRYAPTSQDFNHSNNSVFTYLGDHVTSGRSHQTSSRDEPPPPYSISRISEQTTSGSRAMTSSGPTSYQQGLDTHYF
ncbi:hypothetical protein ACF0H5_024389 [Mactra antiquata]